VYVAEVSYRKSHIGQLGEVTIQIEREPARLVGHTVRVGGERSP